MRAAVWCLVLAACAALVHAKTLIELIEERPELSTFLQLAQEDSLIPLIMRQEEGTVFAPTNEALEKYKGTRNYKLIKYHMVNVALPSDQLKARTTMLTRLKGNPKIFITVQRQARGAPEEIFVNNARITGRDLRATSAKDFDQVLHIIDDVLEPTIPINDKLSNLFKPSALDLLQNSNEFNQTAEEPTSIRRFNQKVEELEKSNIFSSGPNNTYFIPVDEGLDDVWNTINKTVVDSHVIPGKALFTRTMGNGTYETMAFAEMPKVVVRLRRERYPTQDAGTYYEIESKTILSDGQHRAGTVLSKVIKPNIVVSNGVVHIIEKPLVATQASVYDYLMERKQDRFYEFINLLENIDPDFLESLRGIYNSTIFVPSNEAFYTVDEKRLTELKLSPEKMRKLLQLHLVNSEITMEVLRKAPQSPLYTVASSDAGRQLFLTVSGLEGVNQTMTVEGGGTNASVVVSDIVASNGVIHVIDKLLGIPYRSVGDKLAVDAMMSETNELASQKEFGDMVRAMDQKFTMLVPSNDAWKKIRIEFPTAHKNLFSGKATYQSTRILERHLMIGNAYSMDQLVEMTRANGSVKSFHQDAFAFERVPGESGYLVRWQGREARVTRSNVECTNGYIHVIDSVFMLHRDVTTTGGAAALASSAACLLTALAALRL